MRKKLILLIGIIVISSFSIGYIATILINNASNPINDKIPEFFIVIDDIYWYKDIDNNNHFFGSDDYLKSGRKNVKCEISFYIYQTTGYFNDSDWFFLNK